MVPGAGDGGRVRRPSCPARPTAATSPRCSTTSPYPPGHVSPGCTTRSSTSPTPVGLPRDPRLRRGARRRRRRARARQPAAARGRAASTSRTTASPLTRGTPPCSSASVSTHRVLLVGTGLTTVDVVAQVAGARPGASLTAVSRHGLLPLRHLRRPARPRPGLRRRRRAPCEGCWPRSVAASPTGPTGDVWSSRSRRPPTTCGPRSRTTTRSGSPGTSGATGRSRDTGWHRRWQRSSTTCWPPAG